MVKHFVVIAYDISDDGRRQRVAEFLAGYGRRVNYSVFECLLTGKELDKVREEIKKMINFREDRVLYYRLCRGCFVRTLRDGRGEIEPETVELF